ncbi:MAG: M20/M25/M40 family metallo-hydrolase [Clostridia bacterium]
MIENLVEAIKIQTTRDVNEENMPKLHKFLEKAFPLVHKNMEKTVVNGSLLFKIHGTGKTIMFCGHMDVVSVNEESWDYPPYGGVIEDGFLYGRGAIDCKNVVIGLLSAMENLFAEGFTPKNTIYFAFGHDEEIGGANGANKIVEMLKAQGVKLDLVLDEGGHVDTDFLPDRKYATIALAEKNILRLKLIAPDKGGHAAGISSKTGLYRIAKAIIAIEENPMPTKMIPLVSQYKAVLGESYPKLVENFEEKYIPLVRNTIAPTMTEASSAPNILPNKASVTCDIRLLPGEEKESVINYIKELTKGLDLQFEIVSAKFNNGLVTDFNSFYYKEIEKLIKEKFDDAIVVPTLMAGGTDASYYQEICDVVLRFMPMELETKIAKRMHTDNECISVKSFEKAVDFYKTFIKMHG